MRAVCYTKYNTHTEPLLNMCNALKFNYLYDTKLLIFYHKLLNNNISSNFLNFKQMKDTLFAHLNIYFLCITLDIIN